MKKFVLVIFIFFLGTISYAQTWVNDTKTFFQSNSAVVLTVNLRNFSAIDLDSNGIIQRNKGETQGNFVNAVKRLDEISKLGINTIHILPINPLGKKHAYGTAGNLFAVSDLTSLNPDLRSLESSLIVELQAKNFIDECHSRNIRVIVEVPAYASYDLYLKKPGLFLKDNQRRSIIPNGQKDLRVLDGGNYSKINSAVFKMYEKYINLLMSIGVDGVVVQDPFVKPVKFWSALISNAKIQDPEFLFIAEMTPFGHRVFSKYGSNLRLSTLLKVGFDTFYADFSDVLGWNKTSDFFDKFTKNIKYVNKFSDKKSAVGYFASYNDVSPMSVNDTYLSNMIIWLNSTLPVNSLYLDGFQYGDDYDFPWANLRALDSNTDSDIYFVNKGKFDLYNYSRRPNGLYNEIKDEFIRGNKFKTYMAQFVPNGVFVRLDSKPDNVFAYAITDRKLNNTVFVIGSLDLENINNVEINLPRMSSKYAVNIVRSVAIPQLKRNKIYSVIAPRDIQVFTISGFSVK